MEHAPAYKVRRGVTRVGNWRSAKDAAKALIRAGKRDDAEISAWTGATKLSIATYRRDTKRATPVKAN